MILKQYVYNITYGTLNLLILLNLTVRKVIESPWRLYTLLNLLIYGSQKVHLVVWLSITFWIWFITLLTIQLNIVAMLANKIEHQLFQRGKLLFKIYMFASKSRWAYWMSACLPCHGPPSQFWPLLLTTTMVARYLYSLFSTSSLTNIESNDWDSGHDMTIQIQTSHSHSLNPVHTTPADNCCSQHFQPMSLSTYCYDFSICPPPVILLSLPTCFIVIPWTCCFTSSFLLSSMLVLSYVLLLVLSLVSSLT